jgi:hypothetical protein
LLLSQVEDIATPNTHPSFHAYQVKTVVRTSLLQLLLPMLLLSITALVVFLDNLRVCAWPCMGVQVQALVTDVREALCKVPDAMFDEVASSNVPTTTYEVGRRDGDRLQLEHLPQLRNL